LLLNFSKYFISLVGCCIKAIAGIIKNDKKYLRSTMSFNKLNNWLKSSIRAVLTIFICGLLFISVANPVQAATSKPSDGEANLNKIQDKTDDAARSAPFGIDEITKESQKGLNEVQGSADAEKMISPEETDTPSVKDKAASFFDNLKK
jgi:hypothetical protein